ncbi:AMP-binding protein [Desulfosudis oleivorans]|uniref:AMP-dependent synthetase and ligase n=1 Tax=Desulfosudis oleivorans (strain DSM 6200 / JCM 39069 / Hxd3) TaxID=96561 RepID=A8ZTY9_DESOH|nr:AMP-binding protein [Desulfosudis oleivorans]ABW67922.1 AMP-dependent synthetase and ligase [Desulfosudis oleivorans Hxd3]
MSISLKTLVRGCSGFVNFGAMIRLTLGSRLRAWRTFFIFEGREYTYGEVYAQAKRYAEFFDALRCRSIGAGRMGENDRLALAIYQENTPEYLFASFAAGLSNATLFAVNTGFRGKTLAGVVEKAKALFLLTDEVSAPEVAAVLPELKTLGREHVLITGNAGPQSAGFTPIETAMADMALNGGQAKCPAVDNTRPVLVIYTSGTTGLPKGVPCTHLKMIGAGAVVQSTVRLKKEDRGYICMPLFHSNAWYVGVLSIMIAGASFVLKRKFSASAFESDILEHGVTFMNYVGQPLHYILTALEKKYGSAEDVEAALAHHPKNRFRIAYGNGATVVDRVKVKKCLNMEHVFEIYGSTEAVITTANKPGDPIESMGRVPGSVVILNEAGAVCEPGVVGEDGRLVNYDAAVGEICKKAGKDNLRFDGYYDDNAATCKKFRDDGYFHSGDLGHIRVVNNRRYLYFNGRTDDWIRKDGENFSAESAAEYAAKIPSVALAVAYGAPCAVSDEKVMATIQMRENVAFDPQQAFDALMAQQKTGGMDPKWMPDYIRIIDAFNVTSTQKILVRPFKQQHFNLEKHPDMVVYHRRRGDTAYHRLTPEAYADIKAEFEKNGRASLLG